MNELHEVLQRATEHVSSPDLSGAAWAEARRRRTRRRAAASAVGAAVLVAAVSVPLALGGRPDAAPPVDSPTPAPSPSLDPDERAAARTEATQPVWDPFTVVDAPRRASVLPERLDPPAAPPALDEQPMDAAVLAWPEEGADLRLLGTDGQWRSVPDTADPEGAYTRPMVGMPRLTDDGTRVAMSTEAGALVVDVTTGERQVLPWPDEVAPPWDIAPALTWLPGEDELLVDHWRQQWIVGLDGGDRAAPYGRGLVDGLAIDTGGDGGVVYQRRAQQGDVLRWKGEESDRAFDFPWWGQRFVAGDGLLAFTGGSPLDDYGVAGPMVVDTATGELVAYAPIRDRASIYSDNGYLTAQGFLDPETVLLLVGPMDFRTMEAGEGQWHLVAWEWASGDFELISTGDSLDTARIDVVPGLVE